MAFTLAGEVITKRVCELGSREAEIIIGTVLFFMRLHLEKNKMRRKFLADCLI
jgi:hypothetical protein